MNASNSTFPNGWTRKPLCEVATFVKGSGLPKAALVVDGTEPCIHYGELFTKYPFAIDTVTSRCFPFEGAVRSREGDVLFPASDVTPSGLGTAASVMVDGVILGGDVLVARPDSAVIYGPFISAWIRSHSLAVLRLVKGSTVYHLHAKDLAGLTVTFPPIEEQRAIAAALSDASAWVESLEALIAKKREIKQAAVQQLMSVRLRLSGYDDVWMPHTFGQLCQPKTARSSAESDSKELRCVDLEHLESGTGRLLGTTSMSTSLSQKTRFVAGDVLFGKLRAYLKKSWLASFDGVCSTEIWVLEPIARNCDSSYLAQLVRTDGFAEAAGSTYGTHMPRSEWNVVKNWEVLVPAVDEQRAIGTVLGEMDAEIDALVGQRDKAELIRQGMAQDLLTGKVRLV